MRFTLILISVSLSLKVFLSRKFQTHLLRQKKSELGVVMIGGSYTCVISKAIVRTQGNKGTSNAMSLTDCESDYVM